MCVAFYVQPSSVFSPAAASTDQHCCYFTADFASSSSTPFVGPRQQLVAISRGTLAHTALRHSPSTAKAPLSMAALCCTSSTAAAVAKIKPHLSHAGPAVARMSVPRTCPCPRICARPSLTNFPSRVVAGAGGRDVPAAREEELSGIIFQPFQEVQAQLGVLDDIMDNAGVPGPTTMSAVSMARHNYEQQLEAALNEQINVEYTMSYIYHSLSAFMDRDNVGLPGFAAYFKAQSDEERHHANLLMVHQNRRGGRVKLQTVLRPESEYVSEARGEALWALELSLGLEKLNFGKLRELHDVAAAANDAEVQHFIEDYLLHEQAKDVKYAADLVSRARRAGTGLGVFELDVLLQRKYGYGLAREDGDGAAANGNGNGA